MPIYSLRYISENVESSSISSSFHFSPSKVNEKDAKGELYALITVIGEEGIDSERIAKFVWDAIADAYFYAPFSTVIDNLKEAVIQGSHKASELIRNQPELEGKGINLSFALAAFKGKGTYLTVFGEQQLILYKNGGVVKVSEIVTQNKGVVANLAWSDTDLLLMGSPNLMDSLIPIINKGDTPDEVVETINNFTSNLSTYQSILMLSGKSYQYIDVAPAKKTEPIVVDLPVNNIKVEKDLPKKIERKEKPKIEKKKFDISKYINKVKELSLVLVNKVKGLKPILSKLKNLYNRFIDFLSRIWGKILGKLNGLLMNKYGKQHWFKSLMSKFSTINIGRKKSTYGMKIDGYKENDLRKKRFGIVFLVIIAAVSVFGLYNLSQKANERRRVHKDAEIIMIELENQIANIESLRLTDAGEAKVQMTYIPDLINSLDILKISDPKDILRSGNIKQKYNDLNDKLNNRIALNTESGNFELFFDGRAEKGDNTVLSDITSYKDELQNEYLLVTDSGNGDVYKVSLATKESTKISDTKKTLTAPKYIDYGVSGVYVFDDESGMLKAPFGKNGTISNFTKIAGLDRDVIGKMSISDLAIITENDNIYLLSPSEKSIIKSGRAGGGYTYPTQYISSKTFEFGNNLANDISIYVMTNGERGLERYAWDYTKAAMTLKRVTMEGIEDEVGNIKAGYSAALVKSKMFIFDDSVNRIIMFEKPSEGVGDLLHPNQMVMENQYVYKGDRSDVFKDVKELAADYNDKNLYVLDGNKIWKVKIKD